MKKILVTGAAGTIGIWVIKYLLSEGKYEITALDIKTRETVKRIKKYHKRINIIYGDLEDPVLIDSLASEHDCIIHLAGICPPICNLSKSFGQNIDYHGNENMIRSISFYHPECFFIFPSTTSLYKTSEKEVSSTSLVEYDEEDYYSETKYKCEKRIKEKLKNYVVFRIPFILGNPTRDKSIFLYQKNSMIETITERDVAYALVKSIEYQKELNKKIKILSGGENCRLNTSSLYLKYLEIYGVSKSFFWNKVFQPYKYRGNVFKQDKNLEKMLNYQNDSIDSYFLRLKRELTGRKIQRFLAKPFKKSLERSMKK